MSLEQALKQIVTEAVAAAVAEHLGPLVSRLNSSGTAAERAYMQRSYLGDLERGHRNPSVRTLVKVANALGVPVPSLLQEERTPRS